MKRESAKKLAGHHLRLAKTPRGSARARRRQGMSDFHAEQRKRRDRSENKMLPGDARGMQLPRYYHSEKGASS